MSSLRDWVQNGSMDRVIFQAEIEKLEEVMEWIRTHLEGAGFSPVEARKIQLAMEEAIVNIIYHAYGGERGVIELICHAVPHKRVAFTLMDKGSSFNPLLQNHRISTELSLEERVEGGLGIYFIKAFMDEVHYERRHPYNILTLTKTL